MRSFLVETYVPRSGRGDAAALGSRARSAAEELVRAGLSIHYVRTTFLPDDETCFHLVEADSRDTVSELCRRAGIGHARITRAVDEPS